ISLQVGAGGSTLVTSSALARAQGATVTFNGNANDLGNVQRLMFLNAGTGPTLTGGILPYAVVTGPAGFDLARYDVTGVTRVTSYVTNVNLALPTDNVKISSDQSIVGSPTV